MENLFTMTDTVITVCYINAVAFIIIWRNNIFKEETHSVHIKIQVFRFVVHSPEATPI